MLPASVILAARGPITALAFLVSTATFSAGAFFVALRNTAIDCQKGSATNAACGVDVLTDIITLVAAVGATVGATAIGLTTPTPRGLSAPVFRVDGVDLDWHEHVNMQRHGLNRTIDDPAIVEWQLNHTMPIQTYITYEKDGYLVKRVDSGIDMPDPNGKRGMCRAYYDTRFWTDDLRSWEFDRKPSTADWGDAAEDIFFEFADMNWQAGCVWMKGSNVPGTNEIYEASFELGASCSEDEPANLNCGTASYDRELAAFNF